VTLPDAAYARLLALRTGLRHFQAWSAKQARAAGLTPAQHQLLLSIRGHGDPRGPTIGEVADYLLLRHHSAVELVDRAEAAGLVYRTRSEDDHRVVRLHLTDDGAARLEALSALHLEELDRLAVSLPGAWAGLDPVYGLHGVAEAPDVAVDLARVYDDPEPGALHVLVDRLWPRGLAKSAAPFETWSKDVAPTSELRKWYGHDPARFNEFARRYRRELARDPAKEAVARLRTQARAQKLVLVTATRDLGRSAAAVLREVLTAP
jgi:uncharacterized protein YeaO (DUF488 family)/DNA-binding MarR family transcriptional regulator